MAEFFCFYASGCVRMAATRDMKKERKFMSSIHLSPFSGPAFIQRSARLVNKMNNLWLSALVLHYPNSQNSNSCAISR